MKMNKKLVSLEAVERERERESYTLEIKSVTCLGSLTRTCNLIKREKDKHSRAMCFKGS